MAPCKRQVKARRHLVCDYCHSFVDFALSGCTKSWAETMEEDFTFQCTGCCKVECLTVELARLTDIVKGLEMKITKESDGRGRNEQCSHKKDEDRRLRGGRVSARKTNGERTRESMACRKVTGEKVTVDEGGGTMGQERREVHVTGGKVNGRKEVRVNVPKGKSITGMMTRRKDAGKKGTTEKAGGRKVNDQLDATRRSYSEAVIEGAPRTERVFMGDSILRKTDKTLNKGEDVVVCLPGSRIENVAERVGNVLGHGQGGSILVHVGTNNADKEGTTKFGIEEDKSRIPGKILVHYQYQRLNSKGESQTI